MPRKSNLDVSITSLVSEINALAVDTASVMSQIGKKLLAVKDLLREKNGIIPMGQPDATGKRAPVGWKDWVNANLDIGYEYATLCIHAAVDPATVFERKKRQRKEWQNRSPKYALSATKRVWPNLSTEEKYTLLMELAALSAKDGIMVELRLREPV